MKKSIFTLTTLSLVFSLSMISCGKEDKGSVKLDPTEKTVHFGETYTITPTKKGAAKKKSYKWSSSNEEVATVVKGEVEAKRIGDAVIYYKSSELTAKSKVYVTPRSTLLNGLKFKVGVNETFIINNALSGYSKDESASNKDFIVLTSSNTQMPALIYQMENKKLQTLYVILENTAENTKKAEDYIEERFKDLETDQDGSYFYENTSQTQFPKGTVFGVFKSEKTINGTSYSLGVKIMDKSMLK